MTEVKTEGKPETTLGAKDTSHTSGRVGKTEAGQAVKDAKKAKADKRKKTKAEKIAQGEKETMSPRQSKKVADGLVNLGFVFPWSQASKKFDAKMPKTDPPSTFAINEDEHKMLVASFAGILETVDINKWAKYTPWFSLVGAVGMVTIPRVLMLLHLKGQSKNDRTSKPSKEKNNGDNNGNKRERENVPK